MPPVVAVAGETLFFQWTTGILFVACLLWAAAFGVVVYRADSVRYRREGSR